jgi:hypothetical protein
MIGMSERHPSDPGPERPRNEPEIIPPERAGRARGIWVAVNEQDGTRRVYMRRPGPFAIVLGLAILGLIALVALIVLLSLAVIWIPLVIVLILAFVLSMYWRRFRAWLARR